MNTSPNSQPDEQPVRQPDYDDPDMEYVKAVPVEEFTERIEQRETE